MREIIEQETPKMVAKKLWKVVRAVFIVLRKGVGKSKLKLDDLQCLLQRGNKIVEKAIDSLVLHHSQLSCRPDDPSLSFISPREYEFSCSASPDANNNFSSSHFINHYKRKHHHHHHNHQYSRHNGHHRHPPRYEPRDVKAVNAVQKVLEAINNKNSDYQTCRVQPGSPGFGDSSPVGGRHVRQLRITDSPFSVNNDCEEDHTQVNKAADEFIRKFYTELKCQNNMADVFESRYHDIWSD